MVDRNLIDKKTIEKFQTIRMFNLNLKKRIDYYLLSTINELCD